MSKKNQTLKLRKQDNQLKAMRTNISQQEQM